MKAWQIFVRDGQPVEILADSAAEAIAIFGKELGDVNDVTGIMLVAAPPDEEK